VQGQCCWQCSKLGDCKTVWECAQCFARLGTVWYSKAWLVAMRNKRR
jgi:hypothetical protein